MNTDIFIPGGHISIKRVSNDGIELNEDAIEVEGSQGIGFTL